MTDESTDKAAKAVHGRKCRYKLGEETVSIAAYILDDGGVAWEFNRDGRVYPLRLSRTGMDAMIALWHDLMWTRPPSDGEVKP
jgi:hypothetical protein